MGRKKIPGLTKRGEIWHIDKQLFGRRICESTGTSELQEAECYLAKRIEELRNGVIYGIRPKRTFRQAAMKYLLDNQDKASIVKEAQMLKALDPFIGGLALEAVHMGSLQTFITARVADGVKNRTINYALQVVRQLLNLAAGTWLDENGLTWLVTAPKIKLLVESDKRKPQPLSWQEQETLFQALPQHLANMALFAVNTGCRDREICQLQWSWEVNIEELPGVSVFVIPGAFVKNREDRLVVLNSVARGVVDSCRGQHPENVFVYRGQPIYRMLNSAWKKARVFAGVPQVRVHDLKHTFGRRLRAAGVGFEDRQDLLGHKSGRITTHYSRAELTNLIDAVELAGTQNTKVFSLAPAKVPQGFATIGVGMR